MSESRARIRRRTIEANLALTVAMDKLGYSADEQERVLATLGGYPPEGAVEVEVRENPLALNGEYIQPGRYLLIPIQEDGE